MSRVRRYSRSGPTAQSPGSPTGLSPSAVTRSSGLRLQVTGTAKRLPPPPAHSSNPPRASPAGYPARGVWAPPRSLAATEGILSFPRGTEMFQFPRCPPGSRQVPGRAPGGLPHSDIPGSQAASASPGHFAAWPRPSSAANAKASTMRPSCGGPHPSPSRPDRPSPLCRAGPTRARRDVAIPPSVTCPSLPGPRVPARSRPESARRLPSARSVPGPCPAGHRPAGHQPQNLTRGPVLLVWQHLAMVCVMGVSLSMSVYMFRAVRAGDQTRTPPGHRHRCRQALGPGSPSGPHGLPRPQNLTGSAWRIVKVHGDDANVVPRPDGRRQDLTVVDRPEGRCEVVKPRPKSTTRDLGRNLPTSGGRSTSAGHNEWDTPETRRSARPRVEPRGFEPRTSAVQGRRSPG
jgi:hypothetical protein